MKNFRLKSSNTAIKFQGIQYAITNDFMTMSGKITERGYKLYLSLLAIMGKSSVMNEKKRKTYIWFFNIEEMKAMEVVEYNKTENIYNITSRGEIILNVLADALVDKKKTRFNL